MKEGNKQVLTTFLLDYFLRRTWLQDQTESSNPNISHRCNSAVYQYRLSLSFLFLSSFFHDQLVLFEMPLIILQLLSRQIFAVNVFVYGKNIIRKKFLETGEEGYTLLHSALALKNLDI